MHRTFIAPERYVQGVCVCHQAEHFERLAGSRAYVLGGETALSTVRGEITSALEDAGIAVERVDDDVTACTWDSIDRRRRARERCNADVVVGVGGGVALDVATAVATEPVEFVSVPTIASTDAPCSTVAVVYDEAGNVEEILRRDRNPELVLVDTEVISSAPVRFLRHGLGDAFATRFEAEAATKTNAETAAGGRPSHAGLAMARECYRRIQVDGSDALAAARRDDVTPALERVVETNVLMSGLGFESGGTAGAHAIQVGLTNAGVRQPHGLLVAFGAIVELVHREDEALSEAIAVARELGLDNTLADLDAADVDPHDVAVVACESGMENEPVDSTPQSVAAAIERAEELLRSGD